MLDTTFFSSIIYIWYEGGPLSPPIVTLPVPVTKAEQPHSKEEEWRRKRRRKRPKKAPRKAPRSASSGPAPEKGALVPPFLLYASRQRQAVSSARGRPEWLHSIPDQYPFDDISLTYLVDRLHSINDTTEYRVSSIEMWLR